MIEGFKIPHVTFKTRVRDDSIEGPNPFRWEDKTTDDYFKGKRVVLFSLPGAFTPTCSTYQLPGFEENYNRIKDSDVDEVYCVSVNDAFVMNAWAKAQDIQNVKVIPDGSGNFTRFMGMLIGKNHLGFGLRSWRYMCVINNGVVERWWQEPGINNEGTDDDPYEKTTPENMVDYLESHYSISID
jgi:peroxiredoxin